MLKKPVSRWLPFRAREPSLYFESHPACSQVPLPSHGSSIEDGGWMFEVWRRWWCWMVGKYEADWDGYKVSYTDGFCALMIPCRVSDLPERDLRPWYAPCHTLCCRKCRFQYARSVLQRSIECLARLSPNEMAHIIDQSRACTDLPLLMLRSSNLSYANRFRNSRT